MIKPDSTRCTKRIFNQIRVLLSVALAGACVVSHSQGGEVENATAFLESRLSLKIFDGRIWMPSSLNLAGDVWSWKEMQVSAAGVTSEEKLRKSVITEEEYTVNARDLTYPVRQSGANLTFECAKAKCISVRLTIRKPGASQDKPTPTVHSRAGNTWYFADENEAGRVAYALNRALEKLGASRSQF